MSSLYGFRVLDTIGNSLEGRIYTIGDHSHSEEVFGITWQTLQERTALSSDDLKRSVAELLDLGLIRQGGPIHPPIRRLLGRRKPLYLWATREGRRVLERMASEAE
ncbi:hypothetical protein [Rhizobium sp.]